MFRWSCNLSALASQNPTGRRHRVLPSGNFPCNFHTILLSICALLPSPPNRRHILPILLDYRQVIHTRHDGAGHLLQQQDRVDEAGDHPGPGRLAETRGTAERVQQPSALTTGRTRLIAAAGQLCGRSGQGDGDEEGAGESAPRGEVW